MTACGDKLAILADPDKDQYFLTNPAKLQYILDATAIRETDHVVELGAGAGTVARVLPFSASLTLVELDERLIPTLRRNAPDYASILNTDGVELLRRGKLQADVILGNLPHSVTAKLAALLPRLSFRVGVLAAGSAEPFEKLGNRVQHTLLTTVQGNDFTPPQPGTSVLISVRPQEAGPQDTLQENQAADSLQRTSQAARAIGVSARSLARWASERRIEPELITPGGHLRWNVDKLRRQLRDGTGSRRLQPKRGSELDSAKLQL